MKKYHVESKASEINDCLVSLMFNRLILKFYICLWIGFMETVCTMKGDLVCGNKLRKLVTKCDLHYRQYLCLATHEFLGLIPKGLNIKKPACIGDTNESFYGTWNKELSGTSGRLVTILKEEHLRLAREFEAQFWTIFPDIISKADEPSLKTWLTSTLAILDRDFQHWSKISHKKISKLCANYIELCREFTPAVQISLEADLKYVADAFHARLNPANITTRSKRRKKSPGNSECENIPMNISNDDFNFDDFLSGSNEQAGLVNLGVGDAGNALLGNEDYHGVGEGVGESVNLEGSASVGPQSQQIGGGWKVNLFLTTWLTSPVRFSLMLKLKCYLKVLNFVRPLRKLIGLRLRTI